MAVPPPSGTIDKSALRTWTRDARDAFVKTASPSIAPPSAFLDLLWPGAIVASYHPIGSEADPSLLAQAAMDRGCALALPHVAGRDAAMRFLAWHPDHILVAGPFGLSQPHTDRAIVTPDIILTPLLGYDHAFNRLGQGAGHYDRAFAGAPSAKRIGVAWSVQHGLATDRSVGRATPRGDYRTRLDRKVDIMTPSWRKPAGMLLILALIIVWTVLVTSLSGVVGQWHWLFQLVFYVVTGIVWIAPLKPLLRWMETGRFR